MCWIRRERRLKSEILGPILLLLLIFSEQSWAAGSWSPEAGVSNLWSANLQSGIITDATGDIWFFGETFDPLVCTHNVLQQCAVYTKWNGTAWDPVTRLGIGGSFNQQDISSDAFLALNGYPCVSWTELDGVIPFSQTLWKCWNGSSWDSTKVILNPSTSWGRFDMDSSGDVWMIHRGTLFSGLAAQVWNGTSWTPLAKANTTCPDADVRGFDIVVDGADVPWAIFECLNGSGGNTDVFSATWNGSSWDSELSISTPDGKADRFKAGGVALDNLGNPFVVWSAEALDPDREIFWSQWNGSSWTAEALVGSLDVYWDEWPVVTADSAGGMGATWTCSDGPAPLDDEEICYSYWNGAVWSPVEMVNLDDGSLDQVSHITFDSLGFPWIIWNSGSAPAKFTRWLPNYSPTVSATWTSTFTATPTLTESETYTLTFTATLTPTSTWTPTISPTWTGTSTSSHTPTYSPTWTTTPTPTWTPSFTKTYTESNTLTITPTWTFTPTPSVTFTWSGTVTYSGTITPTTTRTLTFTPTPTYEEDAFFLDRNAFNPDEGERVNIIAAAAVGGRYDLNVYNSAGELIKRLVKKDVSETGIIRADWDGRNARGDVVSSGVYLIHVEAPKFARVRRIAVIR